MPRVTFEASVEWYNRQRDNRERVEQKLNAAEVTLRALATETGGSYQQALNLVAEEIREAVQLYRGFKIPF